MRPIGRGARSDRGAYTLANIFRHEPPARMTSKATAPRPTPRPVLAPFDVIALVVGLVVGAGIFKAPAIVAANTDTAGLMLGAWVLGGGLSLLGALCYAELAAAYPNAGGEYHFLTRAYGRNVGFLFAWSRLAILQTGSITLLAFVFGDYAAQLWPLGPQGPAVYAAAAVGLLTALNLIGLRLSTWTQHLLTWLSLGGLLWVVAAGFGAPAAAAPVPAAATEPAHAAFGLAMVFVLLTYGGWNEAAYVSAELRNVGRNMVRVLTIALGTVTVLYVLVNFAYVRVLGMEGMAGSEAVTADMLRIAVGERAALAVSALIAVAVFASINVTILTGARTTYALGRDFPAFRVLGRWDARNTPTTALLVQGAIALVLVGFGSLGRSGFSSMVEFVSPVFWLFFLLTTFSLLVLRWREPQRSRPFRVPGHPYVPLVFCAACAYMFYSSLAYTGRGALAGLVLLALGIPLLWWSKTGAEERRVTDRR